MDPGGQAGEWKAIFIGILVLVGHSVLHATVRDVPATQVTDLFVWFRYDAAQYRVDFFRRPRSRQIPHVVYRGRLNI